jgi:hypothetical protein
MAVMGVSAVVGFVGRVALLARTVPEPGAE